MSLLLHIVQLVYNIFVQENCQDSNLNPPRHEGNVRITLYMSVLWNVLVARCVKGCTSVLTRSAILNELGM